MKKRIIPILLAFMFVFSAAYTPALAKSKTKKQYDEVQRQIKSKKKSASSSKKAAGNLSGQIKNYDKNIASLSESIEAQEQKRHTLEKRLAKSRKELKKAKAERKKSQDLLAKRMQIMYMYGETGYLDMIFSSGDLTDLFDRITTVKSLVSYDQKVIRELQKNEQQITAKTKAIEKDKASLDAVIAKLDSDKKNLADVREQKNGELAATEGNIKKLNSDIKDLEKQSDDLSRKIAKESAKKTTKVYKDNQKSSGKKSGKKNKKYSTGGGSLGWPTPGNHYITSEQGRRKCPYHGWETHAGMDIGVSYGDPIVAPATGKVTIAGWYGGYGYAVGIDAGLIRGKHVTILLGHNSRVKVRRGQKVKRGQVVAYGGSTGNSTGPHCHFEVHANGVLQNPRNWL